MRLENIDRQLLLLLNGSESLYLDGVAMTLTSALTWVPLYIALFVVVLRNNNSFVKILLVLLCAFLCILFSGIADEVIIKPLVGRWRPTWDPEIGYLVDVVDGYRETSYGFFSAHAANTFSITVFMTLLMHSRLISIALLAWSLINCWTRIYLGVHFPGDIVVGILWGAVVAVLVYLLFLRLEKCVYCIDRRPSPRFTSTGYFKDDANIVMSVFVFTIVYALIRASII